MPTIAKESRMGKDQSQQQAKEESFNKAQVEEMLNKLRQELNEARERDVSAVRSDLSKAHARRQAGWEKERQGFEEQLHGLATKDLDEPARASYEAKRQQERADALEAKLDKISAELEASRNMGAYVQGLTSAFGVKVEELDLESLDSLTASGWSAAAKAFQEQRQRSQQLEQELSKLKETGTKTGTKAAEVTEPPDVVTDSRGVAKGTPTLYDLRKSVSQRLGKKELNWQPSKQRSNARGHWREAIGDAKWLLPVPI